MIYCPDPVEAVLVRKVNRFLALVNINGETREAHIPNSGRLTELMVPGAEVVLSRADNPDRKTAFTLRSIRYDGRWVCIDSIVPNRLALEMAQNGATPVFEGYDRVRREATIGRHRFDLMLESDHLPPMYAEVKSVTLVEDGVGKFPDAPTERGRSHLDTLSQLVTQGYRCVVIFIVQRADATAFEPNRATDPAFAESLKNAAAGGVSVIAVKCRVDKREIVVTGEIPVRI